MRLEQAIYGASRGGHSMIAVSGLHDVAVELTSRLDLPDTSPFGVVWSPYISGFPLEKHYVLARTMTDHHALRAGMVFSHALIAPIEDMVAYGDLSQIVDLLLTEPSPTITLSSIEIEQRYRAPEELDNELLAVANLLVSSTRKPVVRLAHLGFDQLVCQVWQRLWPMIRRQFAFRLSFGPSDLVESPTPSLVCTPANLATRWSEYPIVVTDSGRGFLTPAAAFLVGQEGGERIRDLTQALAIEVTGFGQLALLDKLQALSKNGESSFATDLAKVRLVEVLASGQPKDVVGRRDLLIDIVGELPHARAQQVRALRNLTLMSFGQPEMLWKGVREWMGRYSFPAEDDEECIELICDAYDAERATQSWRTAITTGLESAKQDVRMGFGAAFWRYIATTPVERFKRLFEGLAVQPSQEVNLILGAPSTIRSEIADYLLIMTSTKGLFKLHAVIASIHLNPIAAAQAQLQVEPQSADITTLRLALKRAKPRELVSIALTLGDKRLISLGAESAAADPSALYDINILDAASQDLWVRTLELSRESWRGPKEPESAMSQLLDQMLDGGRTETRLITLLSETPLADLRGYKRRAELWRVLTGLTKDRVLAFTADQWLMHMNSEEPAALEQELQRQILNSPNFTQSLRNLISHNFTKGIQFIAQLNMLDDRTFATFVPIFTNNRLTVNDAGFLGNLINTRGWSLTADSLAQMARQGREDLRPTLRECQGLLGFWTRLRLGLGAVSSDEKWNELAIMCASLYPAGPDDREIWKRAGGDNADLIHDGDGRTRWFNAIYKIRRGYHLRIWQLLAKMRNDFPWNDELRALSIDAEFKERA